ncbi:MAG: DUF3341 domain-containing protein [Pseudobdellovibrio sp.]
MDTKQTTPFFSGNTFIPNSYSVFENKDNKHVAVFGIYKNRTTTENAVDKLKIAGFSSSDISVLMPDKADAIELATEKHTKAPEGATTGAGTGAIVGGVIGWLAGVGSLAIPGVGPFIAAGPIMAAIAGAGVGGAVGGISGGLIGLGIPEFEAKRYEGVVKDGGILLSVHCATSEMIKKAKTVLESSGAHSISSTSESKN